LTEVGRDLNYLILLLCLHHATNFYLQILSLVQIFFSAQHRKEKIARNEHGEPILRDARVFIIPSACSQSHILYILIKYTSRRK